MGVLSFIREAGEKLFGGGEAKAAGTAEQFLARFADERQDAHRLLLV